MNVSPRHPLFNPALHFQCLPRIFVDAVDFGRAVGGVWPQRRRHQGNWHPYTHAYARRAFVQAEGDAYFKAGKLDAAISAYQKAIEINPSDANAWAEMARIQTYSSALKTTDDEKRTVLLAALKSINQGQGSCAR